NQILGYVALDKRRVKNVFMWNLPDGRERQVTFENRDVIAFYWTGIKDFILFISDNDGDENTMMFKQNVSEKALPSNRTIVYQKKGVMANILANDVDKSYVLLAINDANPAYQNVYKFDLLTNKHTLVLKNKRFSMIFTDNAMRIRLLCEEQKDGSKVFYRVSPTNGTLNSDKDQFKKYVRVSAEDSSITKLVGFDESNKNLYWIWGEKSNLGKLITAPLEDFSKRRVLYSPTRAELDFIFTSPQHYTILAISEYYHRPEFVFVNDTISKDLGYLKNLRPNGSLQIISLTKDMETWLITYLSSENPNEVFLYNRSKKTAEFLLNLNPDLKGYSLSNQIGFDFKARDGLTIQAYLSLPPQIPLKSSSQVSKNDSELAKKGMIPMKTQKMVLLVHGGPQARDDYGFDKMNAFLTSRGYAVLQVNYRGSTGFGKTLTNAGNGEWSRKMHNDLIDAVEFVIAKGISNRSDVAIMGISYGGYATLVGLTFTPDFFACGVDIVGPVNLVTLMEELPPYWNDIQNIYKKPVMIMQGANDPRVKQNESEQFVSALKNHSIPFTYVLYPDEGHGFRRNPNSMAMFGLVEKFLHKCLGGDYQPFTSGQYNESAIVSSCLLQYVYAYIVQIEEEHYAMNIEQKGNKH
ncbi:hypothetical protein PRIPAC_97172, partial [Pristionchus pacificus]